MVSEDSWSLFINRLSIELVGESISYIV